MADHSDQSAPTIFSDGMKEVFPDFVQRFSYLPPLNYTSNFYIELGYIPAGYFLVDELILLIICVDNYLQVFSTHANLFICEWCLDQG